MSLLLRTHLRLARDYIRHHRSRSFLTCLGIAIGVAAIILILSLMGSIANLIESEVSSYGSNLIIVRPNSDKVTTNSIIEELISTTSYNKSNLTIRDVETIESIQNIATAAPIAISVNTISGAITLDSAPVLATTEDFAALQNLTIDTGVFLSDNSSAKTAVLGHDLSTQLFGTLSPIGQTVTLLGNKFLVVGVLTEQNDPINFNNINLDSALIVNIDFFTENDIPVQIQQINARVNESYSIGATAENIKSTLIETKSGESNFSVLFGSSITHPAGSLLTIVTGILTIVAGISLVVGGIGVMNILLVSITERTHEVGVRKAVGASNGNIFMQFLFESLILCIIGDILGLAIGYSAAFFVSLVTPFVPYISWQIVAISFCTTIVTGVLFGLYPAIKASHQDPINSLKNYR